MMGERLIRPTVSLVKAYSDKFSAGDAGTADVGLRKLVDTFPGNVELSDVLNVPDAGSPAPLSGDEQGRPVTVV